MPISKGGVGQYHECPSLEKRTVKKGLFSSSIEYYCHSIGRVVDIRVAKTFCCPNAFSVGSGEGFDKCNQYKGIVQRF